MKDGVDRSEEIGESKGEGVLVNKNWTEIVRIYSGIVAAPLFRVDVPLSS